MYDVMVGGYSLPEAWRKKDIKKVVTSSIQVVGGTLASVGVASGAAARFANTPPLLQEEATASEASPSLMLRGRAGQRGVGILYVRNAANLDADQLERSIAAVRDADFQAGFSGGLMRTVASPWRNIADSAARLGRRLLGLGADQAAGHMPDVAGGGSPLGPIMGTPPEANSPWGGQWKRYQPGFVFEGYSLVDKATGQWLYHSLALEHEPTLFSWPK
jgi:hypothetical protein